MRHKRLRPTSTVHVVHVNSSSESFYFWFVNRELQIPSDDVLHLSGDVASLAAVCRWLPGFVRVVLVALTKTPETSLVLKKMRTMVVSSSAAATSGGKNRCDTVMQMIQCRRREQPGLHPSEPVSPEPTDRQNPTNKDQLPV
ncbi:unnamed protein product [Pleuronectes platessa]|uniref:Uncharacterized protein n=1 Tax=Pleuronectes platessa TaxID=8262 RepID=A0A9N7V888_PLEPL|nr:unnamed protein product [Pleuronectes platessa]